MRADNASSSAPNADLRADAWDTVRIILRDDVPHRKGWVPSSRTALDVADALLDEAKELRDAIIEADPAHVKEELADVKACVIHLAYLIAMSESELDDEVTRKLRLRFMFEEAGR